MEQIYTVVDDFPSPDPAYPAANGWRVQRFQKEGEAESPFAWFYRRPGGGKAEKPLPEEYAEAAGAMRLDDVMFDLRDQAEDGPNVITF